MDSKPAYEISEALLDYVVELGPISSDNDYFGHTDNDLKISKNAGTTVNPFVNRANDTTNPTVLADPAITLVNFITSRTDGGGGFINVGNNTLIDADNYDNAGTLTAVPANRWQIMRMYYFASVAATAITYGQATYSSASAAKAAITSEDPDISPTAKAGVLTTALIVKAGATNLNDLEDALFVPIKLIVGSEEPAIISVDFPNLADDLGDALHMFTCSTIDSISVSVTSIDGINVNCLIEKAGGGNIRILFSDGVHILDCTPTCSVALTPGTDVAPQANYVYIPESTKVITVSTSGWPATEYVPIASVLVQSAPSVQPDSVYKLHAYTDHVADPVTNIGHISHINSWIRGQQASWQSGTLLTPTTGLNTFDVFVSTGDIKQIHDKSFPAFDTSVSSDIYVLNDSVTANKKVGDLTGELTDSNGGSMSNRVYNLVIWGVVSENLSDCKIFCNLPTNSYNNNNADKATLDISAFTVYEIPIEYRGTGFLISRLTVDHSGSTFTILQNEDLRGKTPSTSAGSSAGGGAADTDELPEGVVNLYYTEARVSANTDVAANTTHRGLTTNPHSTSVSNLSDTTITSPADDELLTYSSGEWINSAFTPVFGSQFHEGASEGESSTSSATYQQKLRVTTSSLPSGTYRIGWFFEWGMGATIYDGEFRVQVNDSTTLMETLVSVNRSSNWRSMAGYDYQSLSGVVNIDLDYRETGLSTAYIRRARLEIWRIN